MLYSSPWLSCHMSIFIFQVAAGVMFTSFAITSGIFLVSFVGAIFVAAYHVHNINSEDKVNLIVTTAETIILSTLRSTLSTLRPTLSTLRPAIQKSDECGWWSPICFVKEYFD